MYIPPASLGESIFAVQLLLAEARPMDIFDSDSTPRRFAVPNLEAHEISPLKLTNRHGTSFFSV